MKAIRVSDVPKVIHHSERDSVIGAWATNQMLITKEEMENSGAKKFVLLEYIIFPPGTSTPKHTDPEGMEAMVYVTKGEAIFSIGDREEKVKGGSVIYIPSGALHYIKNSSKHNLEYVYFTVSLK